MLDVVADPCAHSILGMCGIIGIENTKGSFEILHEIISLLLKVIFRRQYSRQLGQYINSLQVK